MEKITIEISIPDSLVDKILTALTAKNTPSEVKFDKPEPKPVKQESKPVEAPKVEEKPAEQPAKEDPKPAPVAEATPAAPTIDLDSLKAFCAQRRTEGVNIAAIVAEVGGCHRLRDVPAEKLQAVYEAVKAA